MTTVRWVLVLAVAALLGVQSASAGKIVFMSGSATYPNGGDALVISRLQNTAVFPAGHTVVVVLDGDTPADVSAAVAAADLVIISSNVSSGPAVTAFGGAAALRALNKPIIAYENFVYDELGMSLTHNYATNAAVTITAAAAGHPLAGGLTGAVQAFSVAKTMPYGQTLGGGVLRIAEYDVGGTMVSPLYLYEKNSLLDDGTLAANRRMGIFLHDGGLTDITADGLKLFDASINFMVPEPATMGLLLLGLPLLRRRH